MTRYYHFYHYFFRLQILTTPKLWRRLLAPPRVPLLLFALLSLVTSIWFRHGLPIGFGDSGIGAFFYNPDYLVYLYSFTWSAISLTGQPAGQSVTLLPLALVFNVLAALGLPLFLRQAMVYYLIAFVSFVCMYRFLLSLYEDHKCRVIIATCGAVFYPLNTLVMFNYWYPNQYSVYLLPSLAALLMTAEFAVKRRCLMAYVLHAIAWSASSVLFYNPGYAVPVIIIVASYCSIRTFQLRGLRLGVSQQVWSGISIAAICVLVNAWFLLPLLGGLSNHYSRARQAMDPVATLVASSHMVGVTSLFRLLPWRLDSPLFAYQDANWRFIYDTWPFLLVGFYVSALLLSSLLRSKEDPRMLFFGFMWLGGFFLCRGINQPAGLIFRFLFDNIPGFAAFRAPYNKFMPLLLVASTVMFGYVMSSVFLVLLRHVGRMFALCALCISMALVAGAYVLPMWNGELFNRPIIIRGNLVSMYVDVPAYYDTAGRYLRQKGANARTLVLPLRPWGYVGHSWVSGYDGPDVPWLLLRTPTISNLGANYDRSAQLLSSVVGMLANGEIPGANGAYELVPGQERAFFRAAGLLGVRHIVLQHDVDPVHGNYMGNSLIPPAMLQQFIEKAGVAKLTSIGALDIYTLPDEYITPMVYSTYQPPRQIDTMAEITRLLSSETFDNKSDWFILGDEDLTLARTQGCFGNRTHAYDNTSKIEKAVLVNPTKWKVTLHKPADCLLLVFLQNFDRNWKVFVDNSGDANTNTIERIATALTDAPLLRDTGLTDVLYLLRRSISERNHIEVNGFANGWYISTPDSSREEISLTIYYLPQAYFYTGVIMSVLTLGCVGLYGFVRLTHRSR